MNKLIVLFFFSLSLLLISCEKDDQTSSGEVTIKFLHNTNEAELPGDTAAVSSDLSFVCKALVSPTENIETVYYRIWLDNTMAAEYSYIPERGKDMGYLLDPMSYEFDYSNLAGIINIVRLQVEAREFNGSKHLSQLTFRIQPVNFPFLFRFYDFRQYDTISAGNSVTIRPFFVPTTVNQKIASMKVFTKTGSDAEQLTDTFGPDDFFYYQTGYLREYTYNAPAVLASGTRVVHRFELISSEGLRHVIQHMTLIQ